MNERSRCGLLAAGVALVGLGLGCRHALAPEFARLYVGDVLWGALFFLLFALLWPSQSSRRLGACAAVTTELIELSQLYQADWANQLRETRLGGVLLGHFFSWSDVLCVFVGAALATSVDAVWLSRLRAQRATCA